MSLATVDFLLTLLDFGSKCYFQGQIFPITTTDFSCQNKPQNSSCLTTFIYFICEKIKAQRGRDCLTANSWHSQDLTLGLWAGNVGFSFLNQPVFLMQLCSQKEVRKLSIHSREGEQTRCVLDTPHACNFPFSLFSGIGVNFNQLPQHRENNELFQWCS